MKHLHRLIAAACAIAALGIACLPAAAQDTRPVRIVLGSAPGASSDAVARILADSYGKLAGRVFIVDNKPGASSNIAADFVAKSPPDGNTLLLIYNAHPAVAALFPTLAYDPFKDFKTVGMVASVPYVLVANPNVPGRNLAEMIALGKTSKRTFTYGTPGAGTPQHLMMERLKQQTGLDITMVHYKSSAPAQSDVMAGHVDLTLSTVTLAMPQVRAGKIKVMAQTSAERLAMLLNDPTVKESGVGGFITDGWFALLMPAKTPPAIARKYTDELNQILTQPAIKEKFEAMGMTPLPGPAEVLDKTMHDEYLSWSRVIKELGIKPE